MSSLFGHPRNKLAGIRLGSGGRTKSPGGQEEPSANASDPQAIAKGIATSASDARKASFTFHRTSKDRSASFASESSSLASSSAHPGAAKDARPSDFSVESQSKRKSRSLLSGFLPRSASKANLAEPSFEVLRVREGSSGPPPSTKSGNEASSPFRILGSASDADEEAIADESDAHEIGPSVLTPTSAAAAYELSPGQEDGAQTGQTLSAIPSLPPPSSVRARSPFAALTRRFSAIGDGMLLRSVTPSASTSPEQRPADRPGTFNLHSMRNVNHVDAPTYATTSSEELDRQDARRQDVAQGFPFNAPAAGGLLDSPGQDFGGTATPPEWPPIYPSASPVLTPTMTAASRLYSAPSHQSSSISVAKFKTGRIRSDSGTFTFDAGGSTSRPMSPVGCPTASSPVESLKPSEQLAALEAEMARSSRATPLLKQLEDRYENHALRSHLRFSSSPGQSSGRDAPTPPQKDESRGQNAWRSSWAESATPDARPSISSRPSSPCAGATTPDRFQQRGSKVSNFHTGPARTSPSLVDASRRAASPATVQGPAPREGTRGRGWDSATLLAHFARGGNGGSPRTLLEALSQMEGDDELNMPPQRRWLGHGADPVLDDRKSSASTDGKRRRPPHSQSIGLVDSQQRHMTMPSGSPGHHVAPGETSSTPREGSSMQAANVLLEMASTPDARDHTPVHDDERENIERRSYFEARVSSSPDDVARISELRPKLSATTKGTNHSKEESIVDASSPPIKATRAAGVAAGDRPLPATPLYLAANFNALPGSDGIGDPSPSRLEQRSLPGRHSRHSRPRAKSQGHIGCARRGACESAAKNGPATTAERNVRPRRAATLPSTSDPLSRQNVPRPLQNSKEFVPFHAQRTAASAASSPSMAETTMPSMVPPTLDPELAANLSHHERNALEQRHLEALSIAQAAFQNAYEAHMRPALASLPARFQNLRRQGGTLLSPVSHLPSGMSDDHSSRR